MHASSVHAESMKAPISEFKPHFFIAENSRLLEKDRHESNENIRAVLLEGRTDSNTRERVLQLYRAHLQTIIPNADFEAKQLEVVMDADFGRYRPVFYCVEGYTPTELKRFSEATEALNSAYFRALELIFSGNYEAAAEVIEAGERRYFQECTFTRDTRTVDNFTALPELLPKFYPELSQEKEIRVLLRYGSFHASIARLLRSRGFEDAEISVSSVFLPYDLQARIGRDQSAKFTSDDLFGSLFSNIFLIAFPQMAEAEAHELVVAMTSRFEILGGMGNLLQAATYYGRKAAGNFSAFIAGLAEFMT